MVDLSSITKDCRLKVLDLCHKAQSSHLGSNYSSAEILSVLYEKTKPENITVSKGWVAASVYFHLARKGYIRWEDLETYCEPDSPFIGLLEPEIEGVSFSSGSMGSGLPMALGRSLAWPDRDHYVLMSDGELNCESTWTSIAIAHHHEVKNLKVIIDLNGFQAMGTTDSVLNLNPLSTKFNAFGARTQRIDGHNLEEIEWAVDLDGSPLVVLAETTKGKGVSFMENNNNWHYRAPNEDEYKKAKEELCQK